MPRVTRRPTHAGTWYDDDAITLHKAIQAWMGDATAEPGVHARALIGPHAGYRYCGRVMAYAYKQIDPSLVSRIFILGPSHHMYLRTCALSAATTYRTPLGDMDVDTAAVRELHATGSFSTMSQDVDEAEHSIELHLPYIVNTMRGHSHKVVPILVGALTPESEGKYGRLLGPYLDDPANLFVVSSDFCHWGARFAYTFYEQGRGSIHESVEWLDRMGMQLIEEGNPHAFTKYLKQYGNTICGRHPISVFLHMLQHTKYAHNIEFKQYEQSSKCQTVRDSSVSYAAAVVTIKQ